MCGIHLLSEGFIQIAQSQFTGDFRKMAILSNTKCASRYTTYNGYLRHLHLLFASNLLFDTIN